MVLQKRLDYGFNGYQVPATPRATRSVRRRVPFGLKVEEKQMCAFDLLATVAGKLLSEGKNVPTEMALVGEDQLTEDEMKCSKELSNQVISGNRFRLAENTSKENNGNHKLNESPNLHNDACSGLASDITTSDCSEKVANAEKSAIGRGTNGNENSIVMIDVQSPDRDHKLDNEFKRKTKLEQVLSGNGVSMSHSGEPTVLDAKPPAPVNRDGVPNVPLHRDHGRRYFSSPCRDVKVGSRDDDENSSGSTRPSSTMKFSRSLSCIRDRRIKKLLSSKYWKVSANPKDEEVSNTDGELNTVFSYRRNCYKRQRSQRIYPFKKRKFFHRCPGGTNRDGIYRSLDKDIKGNPFGSVPRMQSQGVNKMSSAGEGQTTASHSENSHVKLRIKSIKVPELFIEIPETATIGSLKRTVLEAMTTILGGGLHVGVLFQGKKVRDDNKTLLQTGISHDDQLDALGFTLEANSSRIAPSMSAEQSPFLLSSDAAQTLTRYPSPSNINHQGSSIALRGEENSDLRNFVDSDHDSAPTPTNALPGKSAGNSKALVAVPSMSFEALTVVPANRKSKRSEATQRRIRRPFSVHEVEALVQAVEKLGTGRWRDVKLQAFDNAKHRTYVDLKDKWKTLVHTARISPQQRRGEPVPQVLLDRVLAAHAYWSQQQAKQQSKHQPETCLLLP